MSQASPGEGIVQRGKYWGSRGIMTVFGEKGEGKVHPSRHIYYLKILGGRDIMDNDDKGVLNQKRWLVHCGCRG